MAKKRANVAVSIRAPVKGATIPIHLSSLRWYVSIRAPVKGATCIGGGLEKSYGFNPRPREGGDRETLMAVMDLEAFQSAPP